MFVVGGVCKVGGLGVADYSKTGQEVDTARWTAREIFVGGSGVRHTKCDVWSYACTLWEIACCTSLCKHLATKDMA